MGRDEMNKTSSGILKQHLTTKVTKVKRNHRIKINSYAFMECIVSQQNRFLQIILIFNFKRYLVPKILTE